MDEFDEIRKYFLEEAEQHLCEAEQYFLNLERGQDPETIVKLFRVAHNLKGSGNAVGFTELGAFTHELETLLLKIKDGVIGLAPPLIDLLLQCNDHLKSFIATLKANPSASVDSSSLLSEIAGWLAGKHLAAPAPAAEPAPPMVASPVAAAASAPSQAPPSAPAHLVSDDLDLSAALRSSGPGAGPVASSAEESIRVGLSRLERLLNYVGELAILKSVLIEQAMTEVNVASPMRKTVHQIGKVTQEVQDITMSLRMVPMKPTFQKMQRIVRDTSRAMGKEIELSMDGEETEMDKTVLDQLGDPLVHLIRNAIDHGVEMPDERESNGKPRAGHVSLKAYQKVGQVIIEVSDDGRGLDPKRIMESAVKKGVISAGARYSDEEAYQLIFAPGFSTKEQVTDVSGRGVGMDVVKTNIDALRGSIQIETAIGKGTVFRITLPLTLAIIDAMIVRQGSERFIIPLHQIHESVPSGEMQVQTATETAEILLLRDENLPLFTLARLLGRADSGKRDGPEATALIVPMQSSKLAIIVDEIIGQSQAVIKPLGVEVKHVKGFAGSAILGDGVPAVILDIPELVRRGAGKPGAGLSNRRVSA